MPLDYDHPGGPSIRIALARKPATNAAARIGSVFVNPGGPGGSGVNFIRNGFGELLSARLGGRFDVVGFDPRGIGRSAPLHCFDSVEEQNAFFGTGPVFPYQRAQERPYAIPITLDPPGADVEPQSFTSYDQAVRWYEAERDNLMAATRTAFAAGLDRIAWQIPAVTLDDLGTRLRLSHRLPGAAEHYLGALSAYRDVGDRHGEARTLNGLGLVYSHDHQLAEAIVRFEEALTLARTLDNRSLVGVALRSLGSAYFDYGRLRDAQALLREAAETFHEIGEPMEESSALRYLSEAERELGRLSEARQSAHRALTIAREHKISLREGTALLELGKIELAEDAPGDALVSSQRAATVFRQLGHRPT